MERADGSSLNGIGTGLAGDDLVKVACIGCVDRITDQIGTTAKVDGENERIGIVFNHSLGVDPGRKGAAQRSEGIGAIGGCDRKTSDDTGGSAAGLPADYINVIAGRKGQD